MNREVFEKWYEEEHGTEFGQDYRNDDVIEKGFMAGYQAATKHAQARIAELEAERDALQDEHAQICLDWMSICGTQKKEIKELTAERDALRGVLEEISHDEGRFGLSASDMRELAKQVLARTELAKVK